MQSHHDDDPVPFPGFQQWGNNPNNSQPQNGLQIIVNLPPNGFQQQPQANVLASNHFDNAPYGAQENTGYNPVYKPIPMSMDNTQSNNFAAYQGNNNDDDDVPPPRRKDSNYNNQPDQYDSGGNNYDSQKPSPVSNFGSSTGCRMSESTIKGCLSYSLFLWTIVNFAIIIALLVFHFGNKDVTLTSVSGALAYMGFNLAADPILEVIVQNDGTSCASGYHSMLLGTWPGTMSGCDCPLAGLKKGTCDKSGKDATDLLCSDIYPRNPIGMVDWGGSIWCVKRAKIGTQYTKSMECGSGFRECSPGICVLSSLSCPVTKVKIQSTGTHKLKVGTNRFVVTETTTGESPVIDLMITPNDIPCFSEDHYAAGSVSPYKLLKGEEKGCSKYGLDNKNSFKVDKQKQDKLFNQNDFPSKVMNLPDYDDVYENTDSVLSYRQRIEVAENDFCLSIDVDLLEKSSLAAEKLNKFMSGTSIAAIIIHGIVGLFAWVFIIMLKSGGKSWRDIFEGEDAKMWVFCCSIGGFIEYINLIVMFAAAKHYKGVMGRSEEYFAKLASLNCFLDSQPQTAVDDYQFAVDVVAGSLYKYSLALFLITTFTVIPSFYLVWRYIRK